MSFFMLVFDRKSTGACRRWALVALTETLVFLFVYISNCFFPTCLSLPTRLSLSSWLPSSPDLVSDQTRGHVIRPGSSVA
ncbi:uncharacterized protein EDB91DRAFT_1155893 [Suillus paluster]|uniref:uncharacterized protein n=1 Tax=Suillus paluster TaxID=48578 RepID=UPI001B87C7C7|nr:uncharacterized protein EDB91DRAFT_1155893 [Suillus paluster]KAG1730982.1 hypothetical protein EDB91DRAFT_1155893 [Suillus paluster]